MEEYLSILVIGFFCLLVSYLEYKRHATYLTPFNIMIYPYVITVMMINLFGRHFGFYSVNIESVLFVIACLIFFKAGGWIVESKFNAFPEQESLLDSKKHDDIGNLFDRYKIIFIVCAVVSIIASIIHLQNALVEVGGWIRIASKDFEDAYGKGFLSHLNQLNRPAFTFLSAYYFYSKKKYIILLLVLMFLSVLLLQIKTHIITILLSGIIFSYFLGLIKISFKKIIVYAAVIFALFNLSYVIGYSRIGIANAYSSKVQFYLVNQFFTYLFGGVIGLSEVVADGSYPIFSSTEVFAIPINFYNVIHGSPQLIDVIVHNWIPVSTNYRFFHYTNVFTFFGMLYMYLGRYGTYLYMFFTGIISYLSMKLACKKNAFIGFPLVYSFYLSFLATSFFDIFFNQLQIYHTTVLMLVIPFASDLLRKMNERANKIGFNYFPLKEN